MHEISKCCNKEKDKIKNQKGREANYTNRKSLFIFIFVYKYTKLGTTLTITMDEKVIVMFLVENINRYVNVLGQSVYVGLISIIIKHYVWMFI